ncbi:cell wall-binding repeat-containing protein [Clostridium sp. UBA7503]|uniref:cell wall-binding repeat-containing protein n=1 Tax=Clostridium sp. UBA7503 TaxID=1946377 RepID=UPI0032176843
MKRSKIRIRKLLCAITAVLTITMVSPVSRLAVAEDGGITNTESQLQTILSENEGANLQVKNGLSIDIGQAIDHTSLLVEEEASIPFKLSSRDESIVKVDENGKFVGVATGETFILLESEGGSYLYQVLVKEPTKQVMSARTLTATTGKTITTNSNYRVFIDAGHGGSEPGACANGLKEKDLTLAISEKVQRILQAQGIEVVMRRTTDTYLDFRKISSVANNSGADAFASIHINSATTTAAYGIETYYGTNRFDSKPLAESVQKQLIRSTGAYDRGVKINGYNVVEDTIMPSILTECGFISNKSEAIKMSTNSYQELLASGIANGINNYLKANVTLSSTPGERIYGATRFETSYLAAKKGWTTSDTVIIAPGMSYPDALCSGPLAAKNNAPILLARNESLSSQSELKNLLSSLKVKKAIIVGGPTVLSTSFEKEIKSMSISTERLGGLNRYETSVKIAQAVGTNGEVAIATGEGFADSLSISAVAGIRRMPILLTEKSVLTGTVKNYLDKQSITRSYIIGGTTVISDSVAKSVKSPERIGGANRYETNEKIFNKFKGSLTSSEMFMALGTNFPDALSISALAAQKKSFVLLTNTTAVETPVMNVVTQNRDRISKMYIVSGPQFITSTILNKLRIKL